MNLYPIHTGRPARILGVFAHPDDEVFCAGGTLARWTALGGEAMVLSATRGEAGQIQDPFAATRATLGAVREGELRASCARLGVRLVECLDYHDGSLSEANENELAWEVAARIYQFEPNVVITFGPDGATGHPDHIAISAATTRACQMIARETGHAPRLYYSAFPAQHQLMCREMANWLAAGSADYQGSATFVCALALLADEATELRYADDAVATRWYPAGFQIVEKGEAANSLYLIISGQVESITDDDSAARRLGPGQFIGARELASNTRHNHTVVARDTVTCLVLSAQALSAFEGRGEDARLAGYSYSTTSEGPSIQGALFDVDVSSFLDSKVAALAAHRTQFALEVDLLPISLLRTLLGSEHFTRVAVGSLVLGERAAVAVPA